MYGVFRKEFKKVLYIFKGRADSPGAHALKVEELMRCFYVIVMNADKFDELLEMGIKTSMCATYVVFCEVIQL